MGSRNACALAGLDGIDAIMAAYAHAEAELEVAGIAGPPPLPVCEDTRNSKPSNVSCDPSGFRPL